MICFGIDQLIEASRSDENPAASRINFFAYALPRLSRSLSSRFFDLWLSYYFDEECGIKYIDYGFNGVADSPTTLLEASFLWKGLSFTHCFEYHDRVSKQRSVGSFYQKAKNQGTSQTIDLDLVDYSNIVDESGIDFSHFLEIIKAQDVASFKVLCVGAVDDSELSALLKCLPHAEVVIFDLREDLDNFPTSFDEILVSLGFQKWGVAFWGLPAVYFRIPPIDQPVYNRDFDHAFRRTSHDVRVVIPRWISERKKYASAVEFVSVHLPKCAGSSLSTQLADAFPEQIYFDYEHLPEYPLSRSPPAGTVRRNIIGIHGHFRADRYLCLNPKLLFTFIREPIDRLLSKFFYFKAQANNGIGHLQFMKDVEDPLMFIQMVPGDYDLYYGGFDVRAFDFVGTHEDINSDINKLAKLLNRNFKQKLPIENVTPLNSRRNDYVNDSQFIAAVKSMLSEEYRIYDELMNHRARLS